MPSPYAPRPFRPAWWLPGPHAQTIAGRYLRPAGAPAFRRERLETPDGDFVDVDWTAPGGLAEDAPVAVVVHGLEGSARSTYVLEACRQLGRSGVRAAAMNFRSCSGEMNRAPRFYHAGDTEDLARVLEHVRGRFPPRRWGRWASRWAATCC